MTVMQALIKPDRFEQVLQKGTELGAMQIRPSDHRACPACRRQRRKQFQVRQVAAYRA